MRYKWLYFIISAAFIVPGIFSLAVWGLKPSIDFTGGSILELRIMNYESRDEGLADALGEEEVELSSIQNSGENTYLIKLGPLTEEKKSGLVEALKGRFGEVEEIRFETVGPLLGKELLRKTLVAVILAAGFILAYVAWQFKDKMYGVCAILAMFHDSLILLGSFSLLGHFFGVEVDTLFVTAVLTTLSFSVHDTVVVYDRIRESIKRNSGADFKKLVNKAVNETITRSLNNSLTIIFMLLALVLLGGSTIRWFIVALLIGTIAGTYSSTFSAAPLLIVWKNLASRRKK